MLDVGTWVGPLCSLQSCGPWSGAAERGVARFAPAPATFSHLVASNFAHTEQSDWRVSTHLACDCRSPAMRRRSQLRPVRHRWRAASMSMDQSPRPQHILCLHGGGTNEEIMRLQTAKLRLRLPEVRFHFLEGGVAAPAVDPAVAARFGGTRAGGAEPSFRSWYDVEYDGQEQDKKLSDAMDGGRTYVSRLCDPTVGFRYKGCDEAIARLERRLEAGVAAEDGSTPFDALLGFSQGAVLITLLTALRLQRGAPPPSWRLNICVAGMPVRAECYAHLCGEDAPPLDFPAVVAQGTEDPLFDWCSRLAGRYAAPEQITFAEGHRFPHDRAANQALAESIRRGLFS